MGTNFYRIITKDDYDKKVKQLARRIKQVDLLKHGLIDLKFIPNPYNKHLDIDPWEEFMDGMKVHLGKRKKEWKFCWNFHNGKYYKNKNELLEFIRTGIVVDQYNEKIDNEKFIKMALEWEQPNGLVFDKEYVKMYGRAIYAGPEDWDMEIDGLRVAKSIKFN